MFLFFPLKALQYCAIKIQKHHGPSKPTKTLQITKSKQIHIALNSKCKIKGKDKRIKIATTQIKSHFHNTKMELPTMAVTVKSPKTMKTRNNK